MKGNSHVRFLGGRGRATARAYPAWLRGGLKALFLWAVKKDEQVRDVRRQLEDKLARP